MKFKVSATEGFARRSELQFARGSIQTPAFMPVGTNGTVKALEVDNILDTGAEIILGNTYHLMMRPGDELIKKLGGLHKFSNWDKPILTDSGGFQVWSLGDLAKLTEEGISFQSPYDGTKHFMSPEDYM
ncbi:MAG: tRNA-guanine transglycosylase, partial [Gammaproteobacteria bacterium]